MFFKDKKILIIGGTGTIGKSILTRILLDNPTVVRILSRDEFKQFQLKQELGNRNDIRFLIGDVRDFDRMLSAMEDIDYVFHLAAMKHVESCEYNPYEAVLTNIVGTQNIISAAIKQNVKKVVFTSSDKAISPTNTYGATKLTAERLIAATEYSKGSGKTTFCSVRFGNVMGSRGSVIPLFVQQILEHKKITVTNRKMSRFMMTLTDATELTIRALKESKGGETFVLKMPVILLEDLFKVVIEQTCLKYNIESKCIKIEEVGLRPGEKMYEELMTDDEAAIAWELPESFIIPPSFKDNIDLDLYGLGKRSKLGEYRSDNQQPLTIEQVHQLIRNEKLIWKEGLL